MHPLTPSTDADSWPPRAKEYAYSYDDGDADDALQSKPILNESPWTYQNGLNPQLAPTSSRLRHVRKGSEGWEVKGASAYGSSALDEDDGRWMEVDGRLYRVYEEEEEKEEEDEDDYGESDD